MYDAEYFYDRGSLIPSLNLATPRDRFDCSVDNWTVNQVDNLDSTSDHSRADNASDEVGLTDAAASSVRSVVDDQNIGRVSESNTLHGGEKSSSSLINVNPSDVGVRRREEATIMTLLGSGEEAKAAGTRAAPASPRDGHDQEGNSNDNNLANFDSDAYDGDHEILGSANDDTDFDEDSRLQIPLRTTDDGHFYFHNLQRIERACGLIDPPSRSASSASSTPWYPPTSSTINSYLSDHDSAASGLTYYADSGPNSSSGDPEESGSDKSDESSSSAVGDGNNSVHDSDSERGWSPEPMVIGLSLAQVRAQARARVRVRRPSRLEEDLAFVEAELSEYDTEEFSAVMGGTDDEEGSEDSEYDANSESEEGFEAAGDRWGVEEAFPQSDGYDVDAEDE